MIKCPTCNAKISANAKVCPHCGEPLGGTYKKKRSMTLAEMLVGIVVIGIIVKIIGGNSNVESTPIKQENMQNAKIVNAEQEKIKQITELKNLVKQIPERQYKHNLEVYTRLLNAEPNNKEYQNKIAYYSNKLKIYKNQCLKKGNELSWNTNQNMFECVNLSKLNEEDRYEYELKKIMKIYAPLSIHTNLEICQNKLKHGNEWYYKQDYNEALYYFKDAPKYCDGTAYSRAAYTHIYDAIRNGGH